MTADLLVFAGTVVDRHLSSRWRNFFDRGFFMTHTPSFKDKQLAFLVSGPLTAMPELRQVLRAYASWQETNLAGIVSDESGESVQLDGLLSTLARRMVDADEANYIQPFDFLGAGGRLIFRECVYSDLQAVFEADHRYYARNGYYNFPTRRWGQRLLNLILRIIFRVPRVRSEYEKRFKTGMISAHQSVLAGTRPTAEAGGNS
jgi:multimeric flavodoxin WrbA